MIYEYKCGDCEKVHEVWAKMSDPAPAHCPECQSPKLEKVISATSFALKGSGWYTTDYKKSSTCAPSGGACGKSECSN
jgi:putative FmdB family regulatory protein